MASKREVDATAQMASVKAEDLCKNFGISTIDSELLERFERVTGHKPHPFMRRGLYFAHRDFDQFLDCYENGQPVYIYTGRGPSSAALHLGHIVPFMFTAWLQKVFDCYVVIQLTDDEKYLRDSSLTFEQIDIYTMENGKDILSCDFNLEKTFIFLNSAYAGLVSRFGCEFERGITLAQLRATFGFTETCNTGYVSFPPKQMQPAFYKFFPHIFTNEYCKKWYLEKKKAQNETVDFNDLEKQLEKDLSIEAKDGLTKKQKEKIMERAKNRDLPLYLQPKCLIPSGYEQDPYFRISRDIAPKLGMNKQSNIYNTLLPGLRGQGEKMSASDTTNAIYLTDTEKEIQKKINKYAFSGGRATKEEQEQFGADIKIDVSIQYLQVFFDDDEELDRIKTEYKEGRMMTGEVKKILIECLQKLVKNHQEKKAKITDDMVKQNIYGWGRPL